jgi:hypothetical protein
MNALPVLPPQIDAAADGQRIHRRTETQLDASSGVRFDGVDSGGAQFGGLSLKRGFASGIERQAIPRARPQRLSRHEPPLIARGAEEYSDDPKVCGHPCRRDHIGKRQILNPLRFLWVVPRF